MEKINTGLPMRQEDMDTIVEHGAIIAMDDIFTKDGGELKDRIKKSFIFLRNTGFNNIELDFSRCSAEEKVEFIHSYLTENIEVTNKELADAVVEIICLLQDIPTEIESMAHDIDTCKLAIEKHLDLFVELMHLISSLPIFFLQRTIGEKETIDYSDIEVKEETPIGRNFVHLLDYEEMGTMISIMASPPAAPPAIYSKYFKEENLELLSKIANGKLGFPALMYGAATTDPDEWNKMMEIIKDV